MCLITSQSDAAPKRAPPRRAGTACLITSQSDAAPKHGLGRVDRDGRLITSQSDAAPKPAATTQRPARVSLPVKATLRQNTQPRPTLMRRVSLPVKATLRQNRFSRVVSAMSVSLPVKATLRQNVERAGHRGGLVSLPVKATLRQNEDVRTLLKGLVSLPVKATLRQNETYFMNNTTMSHYQSKRRCAKTVARERRQLRKSHYQSKRRCAKTAGTRYLAYSRLITSQSDAAPKHSALLRHRRSVSLPVKATLRQNKCVAQALLPVSHYQSKRRCAKTYTSRSSTV